MRRDDAYLLETAGTAREVRDFVVGVDLATFRGDKMRPTPWSNV